MLFKVEFTQFKPTQTDRLKDKQINIFEKIFFWIQESLKRKDMKKKSELVFCTPTIRLHTKAK